MYSLFLTLLLLYCNDRSDESQSQFDQIGLAHVEQVEVSGNENNYTFSVTISSPDTGCSQYADWWELISEEGDLVYRRILAHSHVNEQPFTRSGGTVDISNDQIVYVRAHMNNSGYGGRLMKGTVSNGFEKAVVDNDFALDLENTDPQPKSCAF